MRIWPVPPILIALRTRGGVIVPIVSRSGPVTPRALTAASVWQAEQLSMKSVLPSWTDAGWSRTFFCDRVVLLPIRVPREAITTAGTAIPIPR